MTIKKYLENIEDLSNRKILLTGATSGIGEQLFYHLMNKNASVVMLVRNIDKAKEIKDRYPDKHIDIVQYDQSSFRSIESACDELLIKHPDIDTYVLNAGTLGEKGVTIDGYPFTIGVNYFGVRHLIDYLSPKLKNKVRFVIQGSIVGALKPNKKKSIMNDKLGTFDQYNLSKIYLESYFYKLVSENEYPNIEYVLTEPGISSTHITRHFNAFIRVGGKCFLGLFFHHANKACLPLLKGISRKSKNGDFIIPRGLFTMSGYPKTIKFPNKRKREYLFEKEKSL